MLSTVILIVSAMIGISLLSTYGTINRANLARSDFSA